MLPSHKVETTCICRHHHRVLDTACFKCALYIVYSSASSGGSSGRRPKYTVLCTYTRNQNMDMVTDLLAQGAAPNCDMHIRQTDKDGHDVRSVTVDVCARMHARTRVYTGTESAMVAYLVRCAHTAYTTDMRVDQELYTQ